MNIESLNSYSHTLYLYLIIGIIILTLACFILTRKYNWRIKNYYSIFLGLTMREVLVYACMILNVIYVAFFSIYDADASLFGICLIVLNAIISFTFAWNFRTMFMDFFNATAMSASIYLLSLVKDYLTIIEFDTTIYILEVILIILNIIFSVEVVFRKMEIILRKHVEKKDKDGKRDSKEEEKK